MDYILVKLIEVGDAKEYSIAPGSTVGDLFTMAGKEFTQGNATIRHNVVSKGMPLSDGDKVYNGRALKGNHELIEVEFVKVGGGVVIKIGVSEGSTIKDGIDMMNEDDKNSFYKANGEPAYEFRIGGNKVDIDTILPQPENDQAVRVLCTQKLKGND